MYLNLHCQVSIGKVSFPVMHGCEINYSFRELTQTATLQLPRNFIVGGKRADNVRDFYTENDPVKIELGYNGELHTEFEGFVREIQPGFPVRIECEDAMLKLKGKPLSKSWPSSPGVKLKTLVQYLLDEYGLDYKIDVLDMNLGGFVIDKASAVKVLQSLKENFGLFAYFRQGTLHVGFAYPDTFSRYRYHFQKNVKERGDLKYQDEGQYPIKVRAVSHLGDGKKLVVTVPENAPDNAQQRSLDYGAMTEADLKKAATADLKKFTYTGFRGSFRSFGWPRAYMGDVAVLEDARYPEGNGSYAIEAVTVRFGDTFYERLIRLGPKL